MHIINAIKTGDVNEAPRLEAMLSHTIQSNKEREMAYVRQATHDALTGCKKPPRVRQRYRRTAECPAALRDGAG